jgi:hypothetical protein
VKAKKSKAKDKTLKQIGLWATIWWGVSGAYVVLLVWASRNNYVVLSNWWSAISRTYSDSNILPALLAVILFVWVVGGWVWLRELKHRKISYKAAFKDLFLTIR